jgi:hypothetical protein
VRLDPDGGDGDHGLGDVGAFLVILGQASQPPEPFEGSFDHPAARNEDEAATSDAPDDDQPQPEQEAGEDHQYPVVDAVGEDCSPPKVALLDPRLQRSGAVGILDVGGMDEDTEQEARGVDSDLAFPTLDPLARLNASGAPFPVVLTLWVLMMAADGVGSRPSCSRSITTKWWCRLLSAPLWEEQNRTLLSFLSALTRLDIDRWAEVAHLAACRETPRHRHLPPSCVSFRHNKPGLRMPTQSRTNWWRSHPQAAPPPRSGGFWSEEMSGNFAAWAPPTVGLYSRWGPSSLSGR